jgi:hypothetical protein
MTTNEKKLTRSLDDLLKIDTLIGNLFKRNPSLQNTKFGYAYKRFFEKNIEQILSEYRKEIKLAQVNNALEDPKTNEILIDPQNPRGYKYSKEGLAKIISEEFEIEKEWFEKEIEVEPFFSSHVPEELLDEEKEELKGLLFE